MMLRVANGLKIFEELTRPTNQAFEHLGPFENTVLYALVHEPCYLLGAASNSSADRTMAKFPSFDGDSEKPIQFTVKTILIRMFTDFDELKPLYWTTDLVSQICDWPDLYSEEQLARNMVPVFAAVNLDDMYMEFNFGLETAQESKGCQVFVTNTMYHDALGSKSDEAVRSLSKLRDDVID